MKFPKFITFKEGEHVYILQSAFPNYVGKLWKCETDWEMYQIKKEVMAEVQGYRIVVSFAGTLEGNLVYLGDKKNQLQTLINEMAFWYFMNRIDPEPKRYQRWKK